MQKSLSLKKSSGGVARAEGESLSCLLYFSGKIHSICYSGILVGVFGVRREMLSQLKVSDDRRCLAMSFQCFNLRTFFAQFEV